MTDRRHRASSQAPCAERIAARLSRPGAVTPFWMAGIHHHDSVVTPWCRLRTIVDALMHRVAASTDSGIVMAAMNWGSEREERTDG